MRADTRAHVPPARRGRILAVVLVLLFGRQGLLGPWMLDHGYQVVFAVLAFSVPVFLVGLLLFIFTKALLAVRSKRLLSWRTCSPAPVR